MKEKVTKSIQNYESAFNQLNEYLKTPVITNRDRSGVIQAFEFTYEIAWETFKKAALYEGKDVSGPRDSLKQAYALNFIENDEEQDWINMLKDRNITSHTYQEDVAIKIFESIQIRYKDLFASSLKRLKDRYSL